MKIKFFMIPLSICIVLVGAFVFFSGFSDYDDYQSASDINAVVTKCVHAIKTDSDGVPKDVYKIYIRYTFENTEYSNVYWKTQKKQIDIGEPISIKVSPDDPAKPFEYAPIIVMLSGIVLALFGGTTVVLLLKDKSLPKNESNK